MFHLILHTSMVSRCCSSHSVKVTFSQGAESCVFLDEFFLCSLTKGRGGLALGKLGCGAKVPVLEVQDRMGVR